MATQTSLGRKQLTAPETYVYLGATTEDLDLLGTGTGPSFAEIATQIAADTLEDISGHFISLSEDDAVESADGSRLKSRYRWMQGTGIGSVTYNAQLYDTEEIYFQWKDYRDEVHGRNGKTQAYRPIWICRVQPAAGKRGMAGYLHMDNVPQESSVGSLNSLSISFSLNIPDDAWADFVWLA